MRPHYPLLAVMLACSSASHTSEPLQPMAWVAPSEVAAPAAPVAAPAPKPVAVAPEPPKPPPEPPPEPPYGPGVLSVEFRQQTPVYNTPAEEKDELKKAGIVRAGTRAAPVRAAPRGNGCEKRWIELAPRGWVCEAMVSPSKEPPTTAEKITLVDDDPQPIRAVYGSVRKKGRAYRSLDDAQADANGRDMKGHNAVRAAGIAKIDGVRYWQTSGGELIKEDHIIQMDPSKWKGILVHDPRAPLPIWAHNRIDPYEPADVYAAPRGKKVGRVKIRQRIEIRETTADGEWVRIADGLWLERRDVRIATAGKPLDGLTPNERWFDIDLDEQVLFAYEGTRLVYVTLVSTGRIGHWTPAGVTRIYAKHLRSNMASEQIPSDTYDVADVPWTMYFDGNYAMHSSYWHDLFGNARSHGCVNLSPRDARLLFAWSSPDVPPGWVSVYGDADHPGTLVRVRSSRTPDPELRGYARAMRDASMPDARL